MDAIGSWPWGDGAGFLMCVDCKCLLMVAASELWPPAGMRGVGGFLQGRVHHSLLLPAACCQLLFRTHLPRPSATDLFIHLRK